jgi:hypothetical protein
MKIKLLDVANMAKHDRRAQSHTNEKLTRDRASILSECTSVINYPEPMLTTFSTAVAYHQYPHPFSIPPPHHQALPPFPLLAAPPPYS